MAATRLTAYPWRSRCNGDSPRKGPCRGSLIKAARWISAGTLATCLGISLAACGSGTPSAKTATSATRSFTDEAGRVVKVPAKITGVVTIGFITGLDSFLYMAGAQNLLLNGIPSGGAQASFLRPYQVLAPRLLSLPDVQTQVETETFSKEELLALHPSVVLTDEASTANQVQALGIPAVVIDDLNSGPAIEHDVTEVGELLGHQAEAAAYTSYYNSVISQVKSGAASIPPASRPSALYADFNPLTQPTPVEAWAFGVLGVRSVVPAGVIDHWGFTDEQVFKWNPDYIVCQMPSDLPMFTKSATFATLPAVKAGHVAVIPSGFNIWGDNTVEEPLGLLWTAKFIFPRQFASVNLAAATRSFYSRFFHDTLTPAQVTRILNAGGVS